MQNFNRDDLVYVTYDSIIGRYVGLCPEPWFQGSHTIVVLFGVSGKKPVSHTTRRVHDSRLIPLTVKDVNKVLKKVTKQVDKLLATKQQLTALLSEIP